MILDASGREIAPDQTEPAPRLAGPWDGNAAPTEQQPTPTERRLMECVDCGALLDRNWFGEPIRNRADALRCHGCAAERRER